MTSVTGPVFVTVAALILSLATSANAGRVSPFSDIPTNEKSTAGLPDPDVHLALSNSWHQLPNLTAEQRSYAVLLSISRFQDAPNLLPSRNPFNISVEDFRKNANSANSLVEKPQTAPNSETGSRRVLHQLSGYYEFMVEQARGIFGHSQKPKSVGSNERPTQDSKSDFQDIQDLLDFLAADDAESDEDSYDSDSEDVEDLEDPQDLQDLKDFSNLSDAENMDPETKISADLVGALAAVSANLTTLQNLLVDAFRAGKKIKDCRKAMKRANRRVQKATKFFARGNFAKTQGLIWGTKEYLSVCLLVTTPLKVDRGQKLFQAAEKVTFSILHDLTSLIFDDVDGGAASTQEVPEFEMWQSKESQSEETANGYRLKFDPEGSAQMRSTDSYATGEFSATIKGPSGNSGGTTTAFFLSTPLESSHRYAIVMEIPYNNRRQIKLNTVNNDNDGEGMVVDTGVDLGDDFHDFKIVWSPSRIVWYMDGQPLRVLENFGLEMFPIGTRMQLYIAIAVRTTFSSEQVWAPYVSVPDSPFYAEFENVTATSPNYDSFTLPQSVPLSPVFPFVFDYCPNRIMVEPGVADITYYTEGCEGGRWHTTLPYQSGNFSTKFKCAAGNTSGLVSSFYLSSREGKRIHDEIDFEWLGKNNSGVQTNFYVHGYGAGANEVWIPTDFDCADDYHTYLIRYNAEMIQWFIDDELVRTVEAADVPVYPYKPMFLYGSIWDASSIMNGKWSGNFSYAEGDPWTISYRDMTIEVPA